MTCNSANKNLLQGSKFKLQFDRLPDVSFFCTAASIPGMTLTEAQQTNPFIDFSRAGDKLSYAPLEITFLINEDLSPWKEIHDWIRGMGFPVNFDEYNNLPNLVKTAMISTMQSAFAEPQYSDGRLTIYSNKNNPVITLAFKNLFPTELSSIDFSTKMTADDIISGTARFAFMYYDIIESP